MASRVALEAIVPEEWAKALEWVELNRPLVHTITNFVSASLQAGGTIALGGSPVMSRWSDEAEELSSSASSLVVNMGTPEEEGITAMERALSACRNIVFDPVGYGASSSRKALIDRLLSLAVPTVIKGNYGEIGLLVGGEGGVRGVDSAIKNYPAVSFMKNYARRTGILICATGELDIFCDSKTALSVSGGSRLMRKISGGGCLLGSLMGTLIPAGPVSGATAASVILKLAGERAEKRASGPGSFVVHLLDELAKVTPDDLKGQGWRINKPWEGEK
ncbi:MAG: hydroxyethylthiazole kinase [Synergistaceae bacterium]|nr:hydroxyethylthiazole kinase [Synergistaceae bacterium]